MTQLSEKMMKEHTDKVNASVAMIKEVITQHDMGLVTPHEMANRLITESYAIKSECEIVGAWAISWQTMIP